MKLTSLRIMPAPQIAKREHICNGEEARVSRVWTRNMPWLDGLVERKQQIGRHTGREKTLFHGNDATNSIDDSQAHYHYFNYTALKLGRTLFPENFPDLRAHRVFGERGKQVFAYYSAFIPDTTGVIGRRAGNISRYYAIETLEARKEMRAEADARERLSSSALCRGMDALGKAGIVLDHPEANYHEDGKGNAVFFEVQGLDVPKLVSALKCLSQGRKKERAHLFLAMNYAVFLGSMLEFFEKSGSLKSYDRWTMNWLTKRSFQGIVHDIFEQLQKGNYAFLSVETRDLLKCNPLGIFGSSGPFLLRAGDPQKLMKKYMPFMPRN